MAEVEVEVETDNPSLNTDEVEQGINENEEYFGDCRTEGCENEKVEGHQFCNKCIHEHVEHLKQHERDSLCLHCGVKKQDQHRKSGLCADCHIKNARREATKKVRKDVAEERKQTTVLKNTTLAVSRELSKIEEQKKLQSVYIAFHQENLQKHPEVFDRTRSDKRAEKEALLDTLKLRSSKPVQRRSSFPPYDQPTNFAFKTTSQFKKPQPVQPKASPQRVEQLQQLKLAAELKAAQEYSAKLEQEIVQLREDTAKKGSEATLFMDQFRQQFQQQLDQLTSELKDLRIQNHELEKKNEELEKKIPRADKSSNWRKDQKKPVSKEKQAEILSGDK